MRVIIIEEKEFDTLLQSLLLESLLPNIENFEGKTKKEQISNLHRRFHYVVTSWIQKQVG